MGDPGGAPEGRWGLWHPRGGHGTDQLLIVPHAGSRALAHMGEGTNAPRLSWAWNKNKTCSDKQSERKETWALAASAASLHPWPGVPSPLCPGKAPLNACPVSVFVAAFWSPHSAEMLWKCIFWNSKCHCTKQNPLVFARERAAYRCPHIPSVGAFLGVCGVANPE